jgi:hypothetical protein
MPALKQVKVVFDGKSYWLLWHWEILMHPTPNLNASRQFVAGPFPTVDQAEAAIPKDWTPILFQRQA